MLTGHTITVHGETLPVVIRKHRRSKHMVVRYQPLRRHISLTLPRYVSVKQGLRFVEEKRGWIACQLQEHAGGTHFADGAVIPVLGTDYVIRHAGGRGVVRADPHPDPPPQAGEGILYVPGDIEFLPRRVREWITAQARFEVTRLVRKKAAQIDCAPGKISLRDTHSHWGSCNHRGNLSFSWRLALAPRGALDYVVSHEVAHLRELNHSEAFWKIVAELCPDWKHWRRWMKKEGSALYSYR